MISVRNTHFPRGGKQRQIKEKFKRKREKRKRRSRGLHSVWRKRKQIKRIFKKERKKRQADGLLSARRKI